MSPAWWRLAVKDLRLEARSREHLNTLLVLSLAVVTVGELAFHDLPQREVVAAGILWVGFAFAASLGLARAFTAERDRGTLESLLLLPIERGHLFLGKVVSQGLLLLILQALTFGLIAFLFNLPISLEMLGSLALVILLGSVGMVAAGVLMGAIAAETRGREVMGPVLLFPLLLPALIAGVHATSELLAGEPLHHVWSQVILLSGYDVAFLAVAWLLFEHAVEP